MTRRIALATAAHYPQLADDDRVLHAELLRRGMQAVPVVWDSDADWSAFDVVVTRSIWDYHLKYERFLRWLDALDAGSVRVHNPTSILRWNADKHYLLDLERRGVRITPTRVVERAQGIALSAILTQAGWRHAVVKPTVSSTGYQTWFVNAPCTEQDERRFAEQSRTMALLVQEFAAGVHTGELSFVFVNGEYTHCIVKRAAADEFRVHIEWGGTVSRARPDPHQIEWARSVVSAWDRRNWTYARVDAVAGESGLLLMEFELLDPELFFSFDPAALRRFADSIAQ